MPSQSPLNNGVFLLEELTGHIPDEFIPQSQSPLNNGVFLRGLWVDDLDYPTSGVSIPSE